MPYYIRVLGKNESTIPLEQLRDAVQPALLERVDNGAGDWAELILKHSTGVEIALIERNPVIEGELGHDEMIEIMDEISDCKPESSVRWLQQYMPTLKVIYAFQVLGGTEIDDGWAILRQAHTAVWNAAGGILQSDGEGISDEEGFTIIWQFDDDVTGSWNVGILKDGGTWAHFEMDLGDESHREAFKGGRIPDGVKVQ